MSSCETATALVPAPEGYEADLCNPERRADIATYWCFGGGMILSLLFTAQRLYVKLGVRTGWQVDDSEYLSCFALVVVSLSHAASIISSAYDD